MPETNLWTCDCELDFGGRSNTAQGLEEGLPYILEVFEDYEITGTFFISTEILDYHPMIVRDLRNKGHRVGSHGHFHINYKDKWRAEQDRRISNAFIQSFGRIDDIPYRAPHFYYRPDGEMFANPLNHISVLKCAWKLQRPQEGSIFYLHPFDIVNPNSKAPNLFSKILYSRPQKVKEKFEELCAIYSK